MNETVEDQLTYQLARKYDDCQVSVISPITGEREAVEAVIGNEMVEKETVTPKISETEGVGVWCNAKSYCRARVRRG